MDEIKHFFNDKPIKDFYAVFENQNGSNSYYKMSMEDYRTYLSRFGAMTGHWSYTCFDANYIFGDSK